MSTTDKFADMAQAAKDIIALLAARSSDADIWAALEQVASQPALLADTLLAEIADKTGRKKTVLADTLKEIRRHRKEDGKKSRAQPRETPKGPALEQAIENKDFLAICVATFIENEECGKEALEAAIEKIRAAAEEHGLRQAFDRDHAGAPAAFRSRKAFEQARNHVDPKISLFEVSLTGEISMLVEVDGHQLDRRICSPIILDAQGGETGGNGHSLRLYVRAPDKSLKLVVIKWADLTKRGGWQRQLQDAGATVLDPDVLLPILQAAARELRTLRVATRGGWQDDTFSSYLLGNELIAAKHAGELIVPHGRNYPVKGTLEGWKSEVAIMAEGNASIACRMLHVCMAPAKRMMEVSSGGAHNYKPTRTGKTVSAMAAYSVVGPPDHKESWDTSPAAFFRKAEIANDGVLWLDDTASRKPGRDSTQSLSTITYAAANGKEAARATSDGSERRQASFLIELMSDGEESIPATFKREHVEYKAGQESRMPNLPFSEIVNLHGAADATAFLEKLAEACKKYHGTAIREIIRHLMDDDVRMAVRARMLQLRDEFAVPNEDNQERDVAKRFALAAAMGEMLVQKNVLPWSSGYPLTVMKQVFADWLKVRGKGKAHVIKGLHNLESYIFEHVTSRFDDITPGRPVDRTALQRKGFRKDTEHGQTKFMEIIIPSEQKSVLEEMTGVADYDDVLAELERVTLKAFSEKNDAEFDWPTLMILTPRTSKAFEGGDPSEAKGMMIKRKGSLLGNRRNCYVFLVEYAKTSTMPNGQAATGEIDDREQVEPISVGDFGQKQNAPTSTTAQ